MVFGKLRTGLVILGLSINSVAWAESESDARLGLAREYIGYSLETMDVDAMVGQMSEPILQGIQSRQPSLWAAKGVALTEIVKGAMGTSLRAALLGTDDAMAANFTLEELTALRDFYASPAGRSVMGKMGGFMGEVMPRVIEQTSRDLAPMFQRLTAEGVELQ